MKHISGVASPGRTLFEPFLRMQRRRLRFRPTVFRPDAGHPAANALDAPLFARSVLWEGPVTFLAQLLASFWLPYLCERPRNRGVVKSYQGGNMKYGADVDQLWPIS